MFNDKQSQTVAAAAESASRRARDAAAGAGLGRRVGARGAPGSGALPPREGPRGWPVAVSGSVNPRSVNPFSADPGRGRPTRPALLRVGPPACAGGGQCARGLCEGYYQRVAFAYAKATIRETQHRMRLSAKLSILYAGYSAELLSTEGVYSRDMGRGNSREGGGDVTHPYCDAIRMRRGLLAQRRAQARAHGRGHTGAGVP